MIWLGVDAGSALIGWSAIRISGRDAFWLDSGCIEPGDYGTCLELAREHSIDAAVIERPGVLSGGEMRGRISGSRELSRRCAVLVSRGNALIDTAFIAGAIVGSLAGVVSQPYTITARHVRRRLVGDEYADDKAVRAFIVERVHLWPRARRGERRNNNHTRDAAAAVLAMNLILETRKS